MTIKIHTDKKKQLKSQLIYIRSKRKVTLKELQVSTGLLDFYIKAFPAYRKFVRRLSDVKAFKPAQGKLSIKVDIDTWLYLV